MSGPTVLIVMAAHWPRALLRAALREAGYVAVGASTLEEALAYPTGEGGVELIVVDDSVVNGRDHPLLRDLLARHPDALTLKLESAFHRSDSRAWPHVLRRPVSIAEIVRVTQSLLPSRDAADTQVDRVPAGEQSRKSQPIHPQEAIMAGKVNPVPHGYHTITPSLAVRDADRAIAFYQRAFGADERFRMPGPDGKIIHAELRVGDSIIMLSEERLEMDVKGPKTLGGTPVGFYVYVEDVEKAWKRAVDAGVSTIMPLADMFWGDRTGCVEDPFGHRWWLSQHIADLTPEEIQKGQEAYFAQAQSS